MAAVLKDIEVLARAKAKLAKQFSGNFDSRLTDIYILPMGGDREVVSPEEAFPVIEILERKFKETPLRSLLLLGHSGMGKTCLGLHFCRMMWEKMNEKSQDLLLLPLYIYLPQYKKQLEEGLLKRVLKDAGLLQDEQNAILTCPLLLILDGFDEVSIRHNLYNTQGWGRRKLNIKMLISCRPEALLSHGVENINAQALFEAAEEFGKEKAYFESLYLQSFSDTQIEQYLTMYRNEQTQSDPDEKGKEEDKNSLSPQDYLNCLKHLPSLKSVIRTPFLLTVVARALPGIVHEATDFFSDHVAQKHFTQNELFRRFLEDWFFTQAQRIKKKGILKELSEIEIASYMHVYAQNLASSRIGIDGRLDEAPLTEEECLKLEFVEPVYDEKLLESYCHHQSKLFFVEDELGKKIPINENIAAIRSGCLLHTVGKRFRFLHRSITEYLAAKELIEGLLGHYDRYLETLLNDENIEQNAEENLNLNRALLTREPEIILRLAEAAEANQRFKNLLYEILMFSKETLRLGVAAANAITILNYAGVNFSGYDLSEVQISGADLSYGTFRRTNFRNANLKGVRFRQTCLEEAQWQGAETLNVDFGEDAYLTLPGEITCFIEQSLDENDFKLDIICKNGYFYLFQLANLHHKEKIIAKQVYLPSSILDWRSYIYTYLLIPTRPIVIMTIGLTGLITIARATVASLILLFAKPLSEGLIRMFIIASTFPVYVFAKLLNSKELEKYLFESNKSLWYKTVYPLTKAIFLTPFILGGAGICLCGLSWALLKYHHYVFPFKTQNYITQSLFIGNRLFITGDEDGKIYCWQLEDSWNKSLTLLGHTASITSFAHTIDATWLASGSEDKTIRLWHLLEGTNDLVLQGHQGAIRSLVFAYSGRWLASGDSEGNICLWQLPTGKNKFILSRQNQSISSLMFTFDENWLISGGEDKTIRFWNIITGNPGIVLLGHTGSVTALVIRPKSMTLMSGSTDKTVRFWKIWENSLNSEHTIRNVNRLSLEKMDVCGALHFSVGNKTLCKQRGAENVDKINPDLNVDYQAWCHLFNPIIGTAKNEPQPSLVGTIYEQQHAQYQISEKIWVLSVAQKINNTHSFWRYFSWVPSEASANNHSFLIIEGIKKKRRFIIRAELIFDPNTSHVTILLRPLDNLEQFQTSARAYKANQFEISAEDGNKLLRNIRVDQGKEIHYSIRGDGGVSNVSSSSSNLSQVDAIETHNCLTWCRKHINRIGKDMPSQWYNFFVTLPSDVIDPSPESEASSSNTNSMFYTSSIALGVGISAAAAGIVFSKYRK